MFQWPTASVSVKTSVSPDTSVQITQFRFSAVAGVVARVWWHWRRFS